MNGDKKVRCCKEGDVKLSLKKTKNKVEFCKVAVTTQRNLIQIGKNRIESCRSEATLETKGSKI